MINSSICSSGSVTSGWPKPLLMVNFQNKLFLRSPGNALMLFTKACRRRKHLAKLMTTRVTAQLSVDSSHLWWVFAVELDKCGCEEKIPSCLILPFTRGKNLTRAGSFSN